MDTSKFDAVARQLGSGLTRRSAVRGLFAGAFAVVAGGAALELDAEAKRRGRRRRKNKNNGNGGGNNQTELLQPGERCEFSNQCIHDYICEVPVNGSNSDTYCCGAQGAGCGAKNEDGDDTYPYCCVGYECVYHPNGGTWTCEYVPDEL